MMIWCHLPVCIAAYLIDNLVTKTEISLKSQVIWAFFIVVQWFKVLTIFKKSAITFFKKLGFTSCKAEQPLWGMELQEKEAQKDYSIQEICSERSYS